MKESPLPWIVKLSPVAARSSRLSVTESPESPAPSVTVSVDA